MGLLPFRPPQSWCAFSRFVVVGSLVLWTGPGPARAQTLPEGWTARDINAPKPRGGAEFSKGIFTVKGGGYDIADTADQFMFVYRQVTGDVDVIARVSNLQRVDDWSKAGVMVRASLRKDSAHASFFVTAVKGLAFQRRPATGLPTLHASGGSGKAPVWVKLERRGTAVTAFRSADGIAWTMIGSETLALPETFYVGLAVTSRSVAATATAVFEKVRIAAPAILLSGTATGSSTSTALTTASFKPSADHGTRVTSYLFEVFKAGADPSKARAVATRDLGKPGVVNGECKADVSATIAALAAGDYFATVAAVSPGGTSARASSAVFRR